MDALAVAVLLATANKALLDFIVTPIRRKYPDVDLWWFDYVALATGSVITWFSGISVFLGLLAEPILGRILTALLVGGGTALLNAVLAAGLPAPVERATYPAPDAPPGRRLRGW